MWNIVTIEFFLELAFYRKMGANVENNNNKLKPNLFPTEFLPSVPFTLPSSPPATLLGHLLRSEARGGLGAARGWGLGRSLHGRLDSHPLGSWARHTWGFPSPRRPGAVQV